MATKQMKTLTMPNGVTYEIVDDKARTDISTLEITNERNAAPPIMRTVEGFPIVVEDTADRPLNNLRLFGKTTQVTTTGAQLLDFSTMKMDSGGTTVAEIINDGKIVTITGTKAYAMGYIDVDVTGLVGKTLYLSGSKSGGNTPSFTARLIKTDGTKTYVSTLTTGYVVLENDATISLQFIANNTATTLTTETTATFTEVMLTAVKDAAWEPYTGGVASPSPVWPQELKSVENPTINILGKNLIPYPHAESNITRAGITYTMLSDGSVLANGTSTGSYIFVANKANENLYLHAGKTYFFSACPSGGSLQTYYAYVKIGNQTLFDTGSGVVIVPEVSGYASVTLTIKTGITVPSIRFTPQLKVGTDNTEFEAYKNAQSFTLDRTLPSIPVTSDGNYTDENGQQWICDEIDFERGVYIQRVGEYRMTGIESWIVSGVQYDDGYTRYDGYVTALPPIKDDYDAYCTHFAAAAPGGIGAWIIYNTASSVGLRIRWTFATVDEMTAFLSEQYENGTPVTITYPLAVPIETALTEEEMAAFNALRTHYPNTTVINDNGMHMTMTYISDLKEYIQEMIYGDAYDVVAGVVTPEKIQAAVDNWLNAHYSSAEGVSF